MKRLLPFTSSVLFLFAAACSGSSSQEDAAGVPGVPEEGTEPALDGVGVGAPPARDEDLEPTGGNLSVAEVGMISDYLEKQGVAREEIDFFGRLVALQGDILVDADDLLVDAAGGAVVNKGRVITSVVQNTSGFPQCSVANCGAVAPFSFALANGGSMHFRRPDTTIKYYIVVNNDAPTYMDSVLRTAAQRIINSSSSDCLTSNLFEVLRANAYNALSASVRSSTYKITIATGAFGQACTQAGCSNFPRKGDVSVGGVTQSRTRFGDRVHFVTQPLEPGDTTTTALIADDEYARGVALHELLHAMGLGHINGTTFGETTVPGTLSSTGHSSVMRSSSENRPTTLQTDDVATLNKLYSGSCAYDAGVRIISP